MNLARRLLAAVGRASVPVGRVPRMLVRWLGRYVVCSLLGIFDAVILLIIFMIMDYLHGRPADYTTGGLIAFGVWCGSTVARLSALDKMHVGEDATICTIVITDRSFDGR